MVDNRECIRLADVANTDQMDEKVVKRAQKSVSYFLLSCNLSCLTNLFINFQVNRWLTKHGTLKKTERMSGFLNFSAQYEADIKSVDGEDKYRKGRSQVIDEIERAWRALSPEEKKQ